MKFQIDKRGDRGVAVQPEYTQVGDNKVIGTARWIDVDGGPGERYHVLTLREGKIADMQGFTSRRKAERFARQG